MNWHPFNKTAPEKREADLLHEARLAYIEHTCAAAHHGALARMYAERIEFFEQAAAKRAKRSTEHALNAPDPRVL